MKFVFEEVQKMEVWLGECIDGRCQGIERHRVDSERRVEKLLISLEIGWIESESGHVEIEKRVEVHQVSHFLKSENLGNLRGKPRIFGEVEPMMPPPPSTGDANGSSGNHMEHCPWDLEMGSVFTHT
jgi:hypothetical protein